MYLPIRYAIRYGIRYIEVMIQYAYPDLTILVVVHKSCESDRKMLRWWYTLIISLYHMKSCIHFFHNVRRNSNIFILSALFHYQFSDYRLKIKSDVRGVSWLVNSSTEMLWEWDEMQFRKCLSSPQCFLDPKYWILQAYVGRKKKMNAHYSTARISVTVLC